MGIILALKEFWFCNGPWSHKPKKQLSWGPQKHAERALNLSAPTPTSLMILLFPIVSVYKSLTYLSRCVSWRKEEEIHLSSLAFSACCEKIEVSFKDKVLIFPCLNCFRELLPLFLGLFLYQNKEQKKSQVFAPSVNQSSSIYFGSQVHGGIHTGDSPSSLEWSQRRQGDSQTGNLSASPGWKSHVFHSLPWWLYLW